MGSKQYQMPLTTGQQSQALENLISQLEGMTNFDNTLSFKRYARQHKMPLSAPMSRLENLSLAGLENYAGEYFSGEGDIYGGVTEGLDVMREIANRRPEDLEPYFSQAVSRPMIEEFGEEILPLMDRKYAGTNYFGSERAQTEAQGFEDLMDSIGQARSQFALGNERTRLLAASALPGAASAPLAIAQGFMQAGAVPREVQQNRINALERDFQYRLAQQSFAIQAMLEAVGTRTFENVVEQDTPKGPSTWENLAGGLLTGVGIGLMMLI